MWIHFVFPTLTQHLCPPFRITNPNHHFLAIRDFSSRFVVFRSQLLQFTLRPVATIRSIVVLVVQDQPYLKAGIRSGDSDADRFTDTYRFLKSLMLISVKYSPNLIPHLKQIPSSPAASRQSFRLREL